VGKLQNKGQVFWQMVTEKSAQRHNFTLARLKEHQDMHGISSEVEKVLSLMQ
jgi:hypothetical protein